jgi:hypothetical protein
LDLACALDFKYRHFAFTHDSFHISCTVTPKTSQMKANKPFLLFLISGIFCACIVLGAYLLSPVIIDASAGLALIFSGLATYTGVKFIKNAKRTGLLFVLDLMAIIGGTIILIATLFFALLFISLSIDGLPRD